jgi:hypothetical protein
MKDAVDGVLCIGCLAQIIENFGAGDGSRGSASTSIVSHLLLAMDVPPFCVKPRRKLCASLRSFNSSSENAFAGTFIFAVERSRRY